MADQTKACRFCGSDMLRRATYCKECEYFQDWRRFLNFGSTNLALATALVSVLATAAPSVSKLFESPSANVSVNYMGSNYEMLQLMVSNSGSAAGAVFHFKLFFHAPIGAPLGDLDKLYTLDADIQRQLVSAGDVQILNLEFAPQIRNDLHGFLLLKHQKPKTPLVCQIRYDVLRADGKTDPKSLDIPCEDLPFKED